MGLKKKGFLKYPKRAILRFRILFKELEHPFFDFGILKELELAVLKKLKEPPNTRKEL